MRDTKGTVSLFTIEHETLKHYIEEHMLWSRGAFGEGDHLEGLLKHIEKEVQEVRNEDMPVGKLEELVDIIILTMDAMWRLGFYPDEIVGALISKQVKNMRRKWPMITDPSLPTEHIREGE